MAAAPLGSIPPRDGIADAVIWPLRRGQAQGFTSGERWIASGGRRGWATSPAEEDPAP